MIYFTLVAEATYMGGLYFVGVTVDGLCCLDEILLLILPNAKLLVPLAAA